MRGSLPLCLSLSLVAATAASAHGGRTNAQGCHNDRVHGGYHCHNAPAAAANRLPEYGQSLAPRATGSGSDAYYANCSAARAAGAAPVSRGDPGYASHLDRDGDGVGCE